MKWFKHLTDAHSDEDISKLIDMGGPAYYGMYFLTLELIGKQIDESEKCSVSYSQARLESFYGCSHKLLKSFLGASRETKLFHWNETGEKNKRKNMITLECPKLLKIRDNYTKNLQATDKALKRNLVRQKQVTDKQEEDKEKDVDVEEEIKNNKKKADLQMESHFETFWNTSQFPKRSQDDKGSIKKKYESLVIKEKISPENILLSSNNFAEANKGNKFAQGMRRFLQKETIEQYLNGDFKVNKSVEEANEDTLNALFKENKIKEVVI